MLWWLSHMTRIVMKLVTMAKKNGASLIRPSDNDVVSVDGSWRFRTSNVMAKAKTPSLKASVLAVSFAPRLSLFSMGWIRRHASGRFEGAAGRPAGSEFFESSVRSSFHERFAVMSRPRGQVFLPLQVTKYGHRIPDSNQSRSRQWQVPREASEPELLRRGRSHRALVRSNWRNRKPSA